MKKEPIVDSVTKRRAAGTDLGGRRQQYMDSQLRTAGRTIKAGAPASQGALEMGISRAGY